LEESKISSKSSRTLSSSKIFSNISISFGLERKEISTLLSLGTSG
jgi:hypothetical protein